MVKQNYQKVAIISILLTMIFAIGIYQQAFASDSCDYYSCYNYPEQKASLTPVVFNENQAQAFAASQNCINTYSECQIELSDVPGDDEKGSGSSIIGTYIKRVI
jgi:hypothetical protein